MRNASGCDRRPEALRLPSRLPRRPLTVRFLACVLLAVAATAGCGDAASNGSLDAGRDASIDPDGGGDGGVDAGVDAGSRCGTSALCPTCPDEEDLCDDESPCPPGEICLETGCDDLQRCFVTGGGACQNDGDCNDPDYACNPEAGRCLRTTPGCDDSNDCVAGFACEMGMCADRRVPCVSVSDCPHGFTCRDIATDQRFCRRVTRPCDDDIDCQTLGVVCGDVENDGPMECMAPFDVLDRVSCDNSQCLSDAAPVCELTEQGIQAVCGQFGLCTSAADCAQDFECRDLWGDGRSECVLPGGACLDSRQCAPREVCATPRTGGPPSCVGGAVM